MQQWQNMWAKGLKLTLDYNLKENFWKKMYWYCLTPAKLSKMYKGVLNVCWKCNCNEGKFNHMWWTCDKAKKYWEQIHVIIRKIPKVNLQWKPEFSFPDSRSSRPP